MAQIEKRSRLAMATEAARRLIDGLEVENLPIDQCLMMAQRLARLMRDSDAQRWLGLEQRGYDPKFELRNLRTCCRYCWRSMDGGKSVYTPSLPQLEAMAKAAEILLEKLQGASMTRPVANHLEKEATRDLIVDMTKNLAIARDALVSKKTMFAKMKAGLHEYASDTLLALELGDAAEDIFEAARADVDAFVRARCPKAVDQLLAASDRLREGNGESLSAALTSCRRVLSTVADAVFPAQEQPYKDASGRDHDVGTEQYANRLLAYLGGRLASGTTRSIVDSSVRHLAGRLDAIYDKASKGVHADVDEREARLAVIHTYLFLAEVARASGDEKARTVEHAANHADAAPPERGGAIP